MEDTLTRHPRSNTTENRYKHALYFSKITYFMSTGFYKRISSDLIINIASLIAIKNGC